MNTIDFKQALSEKYLSYALSTIMSRSLPDVRDGLKPVHRRILYAMLQLNLNPQSAYKKCARIVGDVIGKYHPHGDIAVYDTLVRLAQNFSLRYPLIDGQGNFGSIDGDSAAAMRYTESKLTLIGTFLTLDIDKDTVDFRPTYDSSDNEPVLMPASFPNLLVNGSEGIAVGMATSIPPHNLGEVSDALIAIIENPKITLDEILQIIKGPDLPTGGVITETPESIRLSYMTGKGSFKVRAKWHIEENHKKQFIIITEIPYQVQKSKLLENIGNLIKDKNLPFIENIRDESAEEIRILIEHKADVPANLVMESLFKSTDLETRVQLNMNVISSNNLPKVMNLLEVLNEFINYRKNIIIRRTKFLLNKVENRLEILEGLKITYLNLDKIIDIIRNSDNPKKELINTFNLTTNQSDAILNMKLRSLNKLDEIEINKEYTNLSKEHTKLSKIISNNNTLLAVLKSEINNIKSLFGQDTAIGARRTIFANVESIATKLDISAFIESYPITVIYSKMGWIRYIKGHNIDKDSIKYKEGDSEKFILECFNTDKIIICSNNGKFFSIVADSITNKPSFESIKLLIDINQYDVINMFTYNLNSYVLITSSNGKGFLCMIDSLIAQTKSGKQILTLSDDEICISCSVINEQDINDDKTMVATTGSNYKLTIFSIKEIPIMKRGVGVTLQKFTNAKLTDISIFKADEGLLWYRSNNKPVVEKNIKTWLAKRGAQGRIPPVGFPKDNKPFNRKF